MALPRSIKTRELQRFIEDANDQGVNVRVEVMGVQGNALAYQKFEVIVPASSSLVIDTNLLSSFSTIDYIINFKDDPITVTRSFRFRVQNNAGSLTDTVSERLGGPINLAINATEDGVDAFTEVTNNESFDLTVTYLKAII